jgi:hypothetical protein
VLLKVAVVRCSPALTVGCCSTCPRHRPSGCTPPPGTPATAQGRHSRIGQELFHRHRWPSEAEVLGMRLAQHRVAHRWHALASRHRAVIRTRGHCWQHWGGGDVRRVHPQSGQPREESMTHRGLGTASTAARSRDWSGMHIHLRRRDRWVSEQVRDHIDTRPGVSDIAAAGMPQLVRGMRLAKPARREAAASSFPIASGRIGAPSG